MEVSCWEGQAYVGQEQYYQAAALADPQPDRINRSRVVDVKPDYTIGIIVISVISVMCRNSLWTWKRSVWNKLNKGIGVLIGMEK